MIVFFLCFLNPCFLNVFQGWPMYAQLLIDLFKYLAPFLRNVELNKPMQILYKVRTSPLQNTLVQNDSTIRKTMKLYQRL